MIEKILSDVEAYIKSQKKEWVAGKDFVNYAGPYFNHEEYVAAVETLLKGWLVMGNDSLKFERKFPKFLGKQYGVLTNSGSSSNLLMMSALKSKRTYNLPEKTKVIMPVAGFPTTVNPTLQCGFEPVFVDIELDTLNVDVQQLEKTLKETPDVKVITFAHVLGNPPNMDAIVDLVKKYDLILLEDCCDALGSYYDGKLLGSFGKMASCSFYPAHHITMGEGGFIACEDTHMEDVLRSFREWGRGCYCVGPEANKLKCGTCKKRFSEWIPSLPDQIFDHKYVYDEIGYNVKPIELQASIGLKQLEKLEQIGQTRRKNYSDLFNIYLKYEQFFHIPRPQDKSDPSWFAFPLTIRKNSPFTRTEFVNYLEDHLIQTRPYFAGNIMLQPAYTHLPQAVDARDKFPMATHATLNTIFHGTSPVISTEQISYIGECVDTFMKKYGG
jgi:CDP-6-deoxy-D-xylo-4-hexulose-3-dehydrase